MESADNPALPPEGQHANEPHSNDIVHRLNWLRAGVLGANDGIVSVAAIVVGTVCCPESQGSVLRTAVGNTCNDLVRRGVLHREGS